MRRFAIVFAAQALLPVLGLTQSLDSNSITVSATRNTSLQPDQVVVGVFVVAPLSFGLTDVLAAAQGLGLTAANFSTINTTQQGIFLTPGQPPPVPVPVLEWVFNLAVPLSKLKDTLTSITSLQKSIGQNNSGLTLSFRVQSTQISQQLQQSQTCSIPDLLADARAQAQKLADASSLNLGVILAMSSATSSNLGVPSLGLLGQYTIPPICALTVKFAATRY